LSKKANILIDAREFIPERMTGIGRMLSGFVDALTESTLIKTIALATDNEAIPSHLTEKIPITSIMLPKSFLRAEWRLSKLTQKGYSAYISPYPKMPLFGVHCPAVNTIHDVLDLSDPIYRKRTKAIIDRIRLRRSLQQSDLTWYDSQWSMKETETLIGFTGKKPRVRHLGIDIRFTDKGCHADCKVLDKYRLTKGYILIVGNGLPHKNLGVLLKIADAGSRTLVFVGVPPKNRHHWENLVQTKQAVWIETVSDEEMPALLRQAFCLSQPSLVEGYGYPPLEAMACGTPAVISDIPVLIETTGGNALVADPYDGKSWLAAYEYLENKEMYLKQVEKGLCWVTHLRGRSAWKNHIADIEELIRGNQ